MADDDTTPPAGTTTPAPASGSTPTNVLTQEYVDTLVRDRVARAREAERAKFPGYDEAVAAKARLEAIDAENATVLEKAVAKARGEGAAEVVARANARLVAAEVRALAATQGFRDPRDALALLTSAGSLAQVRVSDDGEVDGATLSTALEALAKDRPYLLKAEPSPPPPPTPGAAGVGTGSADGTREATPGLGRLRVGYDKSKTQHTH